ncbi:MAG: potassium channel family protein [Chloroflexota bacterium]
MIAGGGRIGGALAGALINTGHEIFIIERDTARVDRIRSVYGSVSRLGDATSVTSLEEAGVGRADLFIATMDRDADNLASCQLAMHTFDVPRTVAVARDAENAELFESLGMEDVVSLTDLAMSRLASIAPAHPLVRLMPLAGRNRELLAIKIPANGVVVGRSLREVTLPYGSSIVLITGPRGRIEDPRGETTLQAEDEVIAVAPSESAETLWETLTEVPWT